MNRKKIPTSIIACFIQFFLMLNFLDINAGDIGPSESKTPELFESAILLKEFTGDITKEASKRLAQSPWVQSSVVKFDENNKAHLKYEFDDVQEGPVGEGETLASALATIEIDPVSWLNLKSKIFIEVQKGLNVGIQDVLDLTSFVASAKEKEVSASLEHIEEKIGKALKTLHIYRKSFNHYSQAAATDKNNKIVLIAVHGTWSTTAGHGYKPQHPLSQAIYNFATALSHTRKLDVELWSVGWTGAWNQKDRLISGIGLSVLLSLKRAQEPIEEVWTIAHSHGCNVATTLIASQPTLGLSEDEKNRIIKKNNFLPIYAINIASPLLDTAIQKEAFLERLSKLYNFYSTSDAVTRADALAQWRTFATDITGKARIYNCIVAGIFKPLTWQQVPLATLIYTLFWGRSIEAHSDVKLPIVQQLPLLLTKLDQIYRCYANLIIYLSPVENVEEKFDQPIIEIDQTGQRKIRIHCPEFTTGEDAAEMDFERRYSNLKKIPEKALKTTTDLVEGGDWVSL